MNDKEPKVCRACYLSVHCYGATGGGCLCPCLGLNYLGQAKTLTASEWAEQHEREAPIREAMRKVERDWIERERRQKP